MPYAITDDNVKLYYEEAGEGTPILFIHEFADDLRTWEPQFGYFSRNYRCIAYNARGFPPSDVPENSSSYSQLRAAEDARDVLKHLGIEKAHIVGLSMGGFASLHFGLNFPEMAHSLVVAGCGYGAGGDRDQWRKETAEIAQRFIDLGMEAVSQFYAYGPTRVQFENKDPRGYPYYWLGLGPMVGTPQHSTDLEAIEIAKHIAITVVDAAVGFVCDHQVEKARIKGLKDLVHCRVGGQVDAFVAILCRSRIYDGHRFAEKIVERILGLFAKLFSIA